MRLGERETDPDTASLSRKKAKIIRHVGTRAKTKTSNIYDLIFFLTMALSRDRDSELSTEGIQSGQGRGECIYRVLRFNPSTAQQGKCEIRDMSTNILNDAIWSAGLASSKRSIVFVG